MTHTFASTYEFYCSKLRTKPKVNKRDYVRLNALFMQFLMDKVFAGERIELPEKMGALSIKGKKQKIRFDKDGNVVGLAPNWKATRELWDRDPVAAQEGKKVYHTNEHSDKVRYRFHWAKKNVTVRNKSFYSLKLTRGNKRHLAQLIKSGTEYQTYE